MELQNKFQSDKSAQMEKESDRVAHISEGHEKKKRRIAESGLTGSDLTGSALSTHTSLLDQQLHGLMQTVKC